MSLSHVEMHTVFDVAAWIASALLARRLSRLAVFVDPVKRERRLGWLVSLLVGAVVGAWGLGTLNLALSGVEGTARSIEGAIFGGIVGVEIYKAIFGISGATGARFAAPLALGIAIGRVGCFFGGLEDFTYGTPTSLPWGVDFGDGIARHPVQLYESAAMLAALAVVLVAVRRGANGFLGHAFQFVVGWYGLQRFAWEFLKPYGTVIGPFTIFHLVSAALVLHAATTCLCRTRHS